MNSNDGSKTLPNDHFSTGHEAAERLGLFTNEQAYRIASQGLGRNGDEQILIIGDQVLRISTLDGTMLLDIHRNNIRSVEVEPGQGLLLITKVGTFETHQEWLHRVPDHASKYLRDCLIKLTLYPPTGTDGQAIPETDWRHEQLARLVGQIVMRAAEAEHNLSLLAAQVGLSGKFNYQIFGRTGEPLTEQLKRLGETSPALADMAERYEAWSKLRNQLVHSIRPMEPDGRPGTTTKKPNITKKGQDSNGLYTVKEQDLSDLVDMYYAYNWLFHDSSRAYLELATGTAAENLSMPNSVSSAMRLPPQWG